MQRPEKLLFLLQMKTKEGGDINSQLSTLGSAMKSAIAPQDYYIEEQILVT